MIRRHTTRRLLEDYYSGEFYPPHYYGNYFGVEPTEPTPPQQPGFGRDDSAVVVNAYGSRIPRRGLRRKKDDAEVLSLAMRALAIIAP